MKRFPHAVAKRLRKQNRNGTERFECKTWTFFLSTTVCEILGYWVLPCCDQWIIVVCNQITLQRTLIYFSMFQIVRMVHKSPRDSAKCVSCNMGVVCGQAASLNWQKKITLYVHLPLVPSHKTWISCYIVCVRVHKKIQEKVKFVIDTLNFIKIHELLSVKLYFENVPNE